MYKSVYTPLGFALDSDAVNTGHFIGPGRAVSPASVSVAAGQ